ncbi:hypothetical protein QOZ80_7BG0585570 [Eleusine coracana subsp. coracana]|nr:hypothetical protein QOZ80_7BG0585570 [Eleusine coracana subsp. coracana]
MITKQNRIVNVSLKDDVWRTELVVAEGVHPRHQTFSYCSRSRRCRQLVTTTEKLRHVHSYIMESGSPEDVSVGSEDDCVQKDNEHASADPAHSAHGSNLSQPTVLQFDEQADLRNRQLLQKRQFFHSQRSQPMALEQVFSEHDSEDEVDEDIADYDNKRMLDDYVGVSKDEKQIMHMWNSFVKKQRVLADRHVPWAYEAFSRLHGQEFVQNTALLW